MEAGVVNSSYLLNHKHIRVTSTFFSGWSIRSGEGASWLTADLHLLSAGSNLRDGGRILRQKACHPRQSSGTLERAKEERERGMRDVCQTIQPSGWHRIKVGVRNFSSVSHFGYILKK